MPYIPSDDLALLRTHPHHSREYLAVLHPPTVLACQLNGTPGDPVTEIAYDNVTEGSYTNVVPGMTLWVGTAAGKRDKGTCRIRKAPTSSILYVSEDSAIDWQDNDYLTVVQNYELWVKYPRIVTNEECTFYKDWDVTYSDQHSKWAPVAVLGPPDCQFIEAGLATVKFVGNRSYAVCPGTTLTNFAWTFPGGTPSSSTSQGTEASPVVVTWDTPGTYWVTLTVTDSNGKSHTGRRPVFIFPADRNAGPYTRFKLTGRSGNLNQQGHTASFEIYGDADQGQFPDRALVVYFSEDWYGGTKKSLGGNFPYRSHIKFVGYIQSESTRKDPQTSVVSFEAATINAQMGTREGFSVWIKDKSSASNWCEATNLTADRAALSLCRYNSTLLDIADVTITGSTLRIKSQEFEAKTSLLQQLQSLYEDLFAFVCCDKQGRVYFEIDPQMRTQEERATIDIVATLEHGDWREQIELPRPQEPKTSFINLGGVHYAGGGAEVDPILSKAPGDAPGYMGTPREINGLILAGQSDGNVKAGLALARDNNEFPEVSIPMAGLWDVFDVVPQEYIELSLVVTDTKRGIVWTNQKLIPRRVELRPQDTDTGRVLQVDIGVEKDSYGPAGVDGDYPDDVPEADSDLTPPSQPPAPPGGEEGDGSLLYLVDAVSGHVYRTRNARAANPADVVYEDLGLVDAGGLYYITLDSWDPKNTAVVCGLNGVWRTTNLDDNIPTWTKVIDLSGEIGETWAVMAASSICQQGLWMVSVRLKSGGDRWAYVYYTTDNFTNVSSKLLCAPTDSAGPPTCEWSSHTAGLGWCSWNRGDGVPFVARTTDAWVSFTNYSLYTWLGNNAGQPESNPHHRYLDNADDDHGLYGQVQGYTDKCVGCLVDDPPAVGTTFYPAGEGASHERIIWVGSYTWGTTKYWLLTYDSMDGKWRFYISDNATAWTLQYTFVSPSQFISGWPYDGEWFYACQNPSSEPPPNRGPILISDDRGATWQDQTGNWGTLVGWTGDIRCCVPVWLA